MKPKKTDKANLEKQTSIFLGIGFIVAISLTLLAFEWTSTTSSTNPYSFKQSGSYEQDVIPNTSPRPPKPPVPPPPVIPESLQLMKNDIELSEEPIFFDPEATMDSEIPESHYSSDEKEDQVPDFIYFADEMPTFRGKDDEFFRKWVIEHIKYPETAIKNNITGRVIVLFIVEPDGTIKQVDILRNIDPALETEVKRVILSSPRWSPGKQRGKPVRVAFSLSVLFTLE